MRTALAMLGFRVLEATTLGNAIALSAKADIIVTDLGLERRFDGVELTEGVSSDPHTKRVPVIIVTAYDNSQVRARCLAAGCSSFLGKPC